MAARLSAALMMVMMIGTMAAGPAQADEIRPSVVKIFSSKSPPNMTRPWEITPPTEVTGSGVLIDGNRILTNAHVVQYAHQIYVQPYESSNKLDASVEFISESCDLATLTLDEPAAIAGLKPVALADKLPELKAKVNVLGYPTGGDTLSVTEGVVSRIECSNYYTYNSLLRIQVDAAINPGNSGGPAIVNDQITGIVFSKFREGDNIGYIIPAEVIRHFLEDCTGDGKFDGFPLIDLEAATLENPAVRKYLKLDAEHTGVVVHRVNDPAVARLIKPWDVITACDGVAIDNLGMVQIADGVRVHWVYLPTRKPAGASVKFSLIREAQPIDVEVPTVTTPDLLIQQLSGGRPRYFVYGGLVFSPATMDLVVRGSSNWLGMLAVRGRLLPQYLGSYRTEPDREVVLTCCPILPHKLTKGYGLTPLSVLTHVNDIEVKNLKHLVQILKDNTEPFVIFRFEQEAEEKIVLDAEQVKKFQSEILANNNIPHAASEDLRSLWP